MTQNEKIKFAWPKLGWLVVALSIACVAIAAILLLAILFGDKTNKREVLSALAEIIVAAGAVMIAMGVNISDAERASLFSIKNTKTRYSRKHHSYVAMRIRIAFAQGDSVYAAYLRHKLDEIEKNMPAAAINDSYLAGIFIRTADWTEAGTILLLAGSILNGCARL